MGRYKQIDLGKLLKHGTHPTGIKPLARHVERKSLRAEHDKRKKDDQARIKLSGGLELSEFMMKGR
jgi:hypothetical protein